MQMATNDPAPRRELSDVVSIQRAARLLDVHPNTIRNWIARGEIDAVRVGPRVRRIPRQELIRIRSLRTEI